MAAPSGRPIEAPSNDGGEAHAEAQADDLDELRVERGDEPACLHRGVGDAVQEQTSRDNVDDHTAIYANMCSFTLCSSLGDDSEMSEDRLNMYIFA